MNIQKIGGIAALIIGGAYIIGFFIFGILLNPGVPLSSTEEIAFLSSKGNIVYLTMFLIYVVSGFSLIILVQTLYDRLRSFGPNIMQTGAIIGLIWGTIVVLAGMIYIIGLDVVITLSSESPGQVESVWLATQIIFEALGGGTEIFGGIWSVLISWTALKAQVFPKAVNYLGLLVGISGIISIVPALQGFNIIFGLGQIPWFICIGVILLRGANKKR